MKTLLPDLMNSPATNSLQSELVTRNAKLLEENVNLRLEIALLEKDNKAITDRVDLYNSKLTEAHQKIKKLLLQQNQQFFELNQRLGEKLGDELKSARSVNSRRLRSENYSGACSPAEHRRRGR